MRLKDRALKVRVIFHPELLLDRKEPTVEPEIIRCKDCKYYTKEFGWNGSEYMVCSETENIRLLINADGFCSWAERRTDDGLNQPTGCD